MGKISIWAKFRHVLEKKKKISLKKLINIHREMKKLISKNYLMNFKFRKILLKIYMKTYFIL
jgi:hypothetical protein